MNKKTAIIMAIVTAMVLVIAIIMGVYYGVTYFSEANKVAAIIEEGSKEMEASNYLSAIEHYEEALSYEPESTEIKNAISYAYVKYAEGLNDSMAAVDAYQKSLLYNKANKTSYWGVADIYEAAGDEENMLIALNTGYENTADDTMKLKIDSIAAEKARIQAEEEERLREEAEKAELEAQHAEVLQKLYECFEAEDLDEVKEMLRTDEFIDLADEVIGEDNSFYYGTKTPEGNREGKGIAVYENGYYYYGDFAGNMRSGKGILMRAVYAESSALGSFVYEGNWENDKPNGEGTCTSNYYKDRISSSGLSKQVITGTYKDGLENGTMTLTGNPKSGGTVKYTYTSDNGIATKLSNESSGVEGQYIVAKSSDGKSNLTSDGSLRGVEGYID